MDSLASGIASWFWQNVIGPAINGTFAFIPLWVWIILGGVLLGFLWKKLGWQGLVGGAIALLTLGAYREGWKQRASLDKSNKVGDTVENKPAAPDLPPLFGGTQPDDPGVKPVKPKKPKKGLPVDERPGVWNPKTGSYNP